MSAPDLDGLDVPRVFGGHANNGQQGAVGNGREKSRQVGDSASPRFTADTADFRPPAFSDEALALRFAERHADDLRYVAAWGKWLEWVGDRWRFDDTLRTHDLARRISREAASEANRERVAAALSSGKTVGAVERLARADRRLAARVEQWDADPWTLNTPGGVVDLRTGEMRANDPDDHCIKITAAAPADAADCPRWLRFLDEATGGDRGMVRFLQQWAGYSLTGDTREHALAFVYGPGGNGKSVFVNALVGIAADYATTAAMETFIASAGDRHPTDLAMLRGARLVTASETEEGRRWAEARIKQLTGGDPITARFMRQDFFTFRPAFKLLVVGNHKPALQNVDDAARRRFNLIPFDRKPATPDPQLEGKLKAEWPGILRWAVDGCLDWQRNGLMRPASVRAATADYFSEQDTFGAWLEEECHIDPGNEWKSETSAALFAAWSGYAKAGGEGAMSRKSFADRMKRFGLEPSKGRGGTRVYRGISLNAEARTRADL